LRLKERCRAGGSDFGYNSTPDQQVSTLPTNLRTGKLDQHLEKLIRELGEEINNAINDSDEIGEVIERIRSTGNDIYLVIEATIAFREKPVEEADQPPPFKEIPIEERLAEISNEDRQFLKSLKIKFD
jgi:hypothetical protein